MFCLRSNLSKGLTNLTRSYTCGPQKCIGNTAIVAGGATGIGCQLVKTLIENGVKNIVLGDVNKKAGEAAVKKFRETHRSSNVCFAEFDASKCEDVERLHECAVSSFGCVDIVCHQTRIYNETKWSSMVDINLKAAIAGSLLAMSHMSKEKGGKGGTVVNIASIMAMQPLSGTPVYCATKHAILGYTRSMGMPFHYNKSCVKFMAMCPGVTNTTMKRIKTSLPSTPLVEQAIKELKDLPVQDVCHVGLCLMEMLTRGENGSVWVVEDKEIYEVVMPNRLCFQRRC